MKAFASVVMMVQGLHWPTLPLTVFARLAMTSATSPSNRPYPASRNPILDPSRLLLASTTPVVLISACGLLTLALYNRLGNVLARIRAFHGQKIELLDGFAKHDPDDFRLLLTMLDSQITAVTAKARVIQRGLLCLLAAMACYLCCSLFAGATAWHDSLGFVALGMEALGTLLFLSGLGWAVREMLLSIDPLEEESAYLDAVCKHRLATAKQLPNLKIADRAA